MTPRYELSVPGELVQELFSGTEGVARLLEAILNQVLSAQASEQLGAAPYQRTEGRQGYRAGSRARVLVTRVGALELKVPHLRGAPFSTEVFERFQRSEQAFLVPVARRSPLAGRGGACTGWPGWAPAATRAWSGRSRPSSRARPGKGVRRP